MFVRLSIPLPYNGGEWRISKEVTGPRGGKHWEKIISQPATGGEYRTHLEEGFYKETTWINGWPTSSTFTIKREEFTKDGERWERWIFTEDDGESFFEEYLLDEVK